MEKWPFSNGTQTGGVGWKDSDSSTTPLSSEETLSLIRTKALHVRWTNGRAITRVIGSTGLRYGIHFGWGKKPRSYGPFGTKQWQSMNGRLPLLWHLSPSNVFLTSHHE